MYGKAGEEDNNLCLFGVCGVSHCWDTSGCREQQSVAQTLKKIKGKVIDVLGEPLIGVNVSVVGQTGGTITDIDGNYSLDVLRVLN